MVIVQTVLGPSDERFLIKNCRACYWKVLFIMQVGARRHQHPYASSHNDSIVIYDGPNTVSGKSCTAN